MRSCSPIAALGCALFLTAFAAHAADTSPAKKYGSGGPIEIASDTLEVYQEKNQAIFTGHVVAIQGKLRLKADKMTVHYAAPDDDAKDKKSENKESIERIEVDGNVFLTTPEETASGTSGVYDVVKQHIVLNNQVVLTRGKNTLKGDKLVYDFNTGKSVITGGTTATAQGGKKERVRALLIPEEDKDKKKP